MTIFRIQEILIIFGDPLKGGGGGGATREFQAYALNFKMSRINSVVDTQACPKAQLQKSQVLELCSTILTQINAKPSLYSGDFDDS